MTAKRARRWTAEELVAIQKKQQLPVKQTPVQRLQALGRLKTGEMNKTEAAYAQHLEMLKKAGLVLWYCFEGLKLRLADNTFLTVDFFVMLSNGHLEAHEVKGYAFDDSLVKLKVAAEMYPFKFLLIKQRPKKEGGGWSIKEVGNVQKTEA